MKEKVTDQFSKSTLDALKKSGHELRFNLSGKSKEIKYSKKNRLLVFRGYDLLENMIVVRQYVQKKHKIDISLLEVLLYLAPKQYFTQLDYREMPKQFKYCLLKNLINTGFVGILSEGKKSIDNLYKINRKGHEIVTEFYELLSGEKKMSETRYDMNPMLNKKKRTAFDKKKMDLIYKINQLPVPESKKGFFQ